MVRANGLLSFIFPAVVLAVDPGEVGFDDGFIDSEMNIFDFFTPEDLLQIPERIEGGQITSSSNLPSMGYDNDDESLAEMLKALEDDDFSLPAEEDNQLYQQIVPKIGEKENSRTCPSMEYGYLISRAQARRNPHSPSPILSTGEVDAIINDVVSAGIFCACSLEERFRLFCIIVNEVQGDVSWMGFESFVDEAKKVRERLRGVMQDVEKILNFKSGKIEVLKDALLINPARSNEQVMSDFLLQAGRRPVALKEEIRKGIGFFLDYFRWTLIDESFEREIVSSSSPVSRKRARCDELETPDKANLDHVFRDKEKKEGGKSRKMRQSLEKRHDRNQKVFEETLKLRRNEPRFKVVYKVYVDRLKQEHPDIAPMALGTFIRKAKELPIL